MSPLPTPGQRSTSTATTSATSVTSTAAAATSTLDTIDFTAVAGHNEDDDNGNDEDAPTQDAHSQNLLSPRRNMNENKTFTTNESSQDDSLEDLCLKSNHSIDDAHVLRDIMEWESSFNKYQAATNNYLEEKKNMIDDKLEVVVGRREKLTT